MVCIKNVCGIFLLKFSTEMLIRMMNGTLTHNGRVYEQCGFVHTFDL